MRLAFVTGALYAAVAAAALAALIIWVVTVVAGSPGAWSWAPAIIGQAALVFGGLTYLAERHAHRRTLERMRGTGEPWAYRGR